MTNCRLGLLDIALTPLKIISIARKLTKRSPRRRSANRKTVTKRKEEKNDPPFVLSLRSCVFLLCPWVLVPFVLCRCRLVMLCRTCISLLCRSMVVLCMCPWVLVSFVLCRCLLVMLCRTCISLLCRWMNVLCMYLHLFV